MIMTKKHRSVEEAFEFTSVSPDQHFYEVGDKFNGKTITRVEYETGHIWVMTQGGNWFRVDYE